MSIEKYHLLEDIALAHRKEPFRSDRFYYISGEEETNSVKGNTNMRLFSHIIHTNTSIPPTIIALFCSPNEKRYSLLYLPRR